VRKKLNRLLVDEEGLTEALKSTRHAQRLALARRRLLEHIRQTGSSGDLSLVIDTERIIVEGDLERYANSNQMVGSLSNALNDLAIVDDPIQYKVVDATHAMRKHRKNDLPLDEARQALSGHYARLNNMDKSRLDDVEKQIIDARKSAISAAQKLYVQRQAQTLGRTITQTTL